MDNIKVTATIGSSSTHHQLLIELASSQIATSNIDSAIIAIDKLVFRAFCPT